MKVLSPDYRVKVIEMSGMQLSEYKNILQANSEACIGSLSKMTYQTFVQSQQKRV